MIINENLNYKYNDSHMLVYDIEAKYNNVYSGKLQIQIDDKEYGYDILFDDMKGIVEWDKNFSDINKEHKDDGTSKDFKGLIDMFNIDLANHVNINRHVKKSKNKKNQEKPKILINYDQAKGMISYVLIKNLKLDNTSYNKLAHELTSQALYITHDKRESDTRAPQELFIGKSGSCLTDEDMINITKVLSKNGIDMSDYQYTDIQNLSLLPASALIKASIKHDQLRDI